MSTMTPFASDNVSPACPQVLDALQLANTGDAPSYGDDTQTARMLEKFCDLFETEVSVFPTVTGTASNSLALSAMARGYNRIYCHALSHINTDECGAPELFTGGAKLHPMQGHNLRIDAEDLSETISGHGNVHVTQPSALSITQANEAGTIYQQQEVEALVSVARQHKLHVHMDGARFANAVATTGLSPAAMTWQAGVDILSFGATKNGCLAAEAVVVFNKSLASELGFLHKRAGQLLSKMRFVSSQLNAYLEDDLWLHNARNANAMAQRLATGLNDIDGVDIVYPVESNELFINVSDDLLSLLETSGVELNGGELDGSSYRLVASWNTNEQNVDDFLGLFNSTC